VCVEGGGARRLFVVVEGLMVVVVVGWGGGGNKDMSIGPQTWTWACWGSLADFFADNTVSFFFGGRERGCQ
jgi:hypothetical protein